MVWLLARPDESNRARLSSMRLPVRSRCANKSTCRPQTSREVGQRSMVPPSASQAQPGLPCHQYVDPGSTAFGTKGGDWLMSDAGAPIDLKCSSQNVQDMDWRWRELCCVCQAPVSVPHQKLERWSGEHVRSIVCQEPPPADRSGADWMHLPLSVNGTTQGLVCNNMESSVHWHWFDEQRQ